MIKEIHDVLIKEALKAYNINEVPISAVIVKNGKIISKAHNLKERKNSVLAHAEILAVEKVCKKINNWRLDGYDIYITLEPCTMCAAVLHQTRIDNIYFFTRREKCGKNNLLNQVLVEKNSNKSTNYQFIDYSDESKRLLQDFFKKRR